MCDKEPLDALGAGAFFYSVLSSDEIVFSSAGADCLERFGPSALHFPRGRQITNNEEEEMKKKMSRTLAVLMCLMTAVAFMPTFAFAEEGAASEQESVQQQEQSVDAQAEEPAAEEEAAAEQEPAPLAEEDTQVTEPAADAEVTFTVSNKGVLAAAKDGSIMVNRSVTVKDIDGNGVLSYDEALTAAHEKYCASGAEGYSVTSGGWVTKLWGDESGNNLFFKNGAATGVVTGEAVTGGDALYASVNQDNAYYADWYTEFDVQKITVKTNTALSLTLKGAQGMSYQASAVKVAAGVKIGTWEEGAFQQIDGKTTNDNGVVELTFNKPGIYYVTASGTVADTVTDWSTGGTKNADCPIMAPVCKVTVYDDGSVELAEAKAEATETLNGCYDISKYRSFVRLNVLAQVVAGVAEINAADTPEKVNTALGKAIERIGAIKTDAQMTADENAVRAIGISSFSVKAGKKKATVKWKRNSKFSGYRVYYKQSGKTWKYIKVSSTASSKTIKNLKKGKKYYFKVIGYKVPYDKTVFGKSSAIKTVRIK